MAVTVIATAGAADANSYITLAEFKAYLEARLHNGAAVTASNDATKNAAVVMATRVLDSVMCWTGAAASATQALNWPRTGMVNKNGYAIASTVIPQELKNATAELARMLINGDVTAPNEAEVQGLSEIKAGPVTLKYKDAIVVRRIPDAVFTYLVSTWICPDWENVVTDDKVELYFDNVIDCY